MMTRALGRKQIADDETRRDELHRLPSARRRLRPTTLRCKGIPVSPKGHFPLNFAVT